MTDVFEEWKKNRFIIAPSELLEDDKNTRLVILTDYHFWADRIDELADWCDERGTAVSMGMTVVFEDEATLSEFVLRWS